jgi:hypothetical protein
MVYFIIVFSLAIKYITKNIAQIFAQQFEINMKNVYPFQCTRLT